MVTAEELREQKGNPLNMTLVLQTESHGQVEAGFYSVFTQFSRLGDYTFATRHLCKLVQKLAQYPTIKQGRILGYDADKFWQRRDEYFHEVVHILIEQMILADAEGNYLSELHYSESNEEKLGKLQWEIPLEDEVDMYDEGRIVPVHISKEGDAIAIGEYQLSAINFGRMAVYLAKGGIFGWMKGRKPEFSEPTIQAIKESKNPLYSEIRQLLPMLPYGILNRES